MPRDAQPTQSDGQFDGMNVVVFTAGDGQRYAFVSLKDSAQVVVFKYVEPYWRGHVEFNHRESAGTWPGEALPEIVDAINGALYPAMRIPG